MPHAVVLVTVIVFWMLYLVGLPVIVMVFERLERKRYSQPVGAHIRSTSPELRRPANWLLVRVRLCEDAGQTEWSDSVAVEGLRAERPKTLLISLKTKRGCNIARDGEPQLDVCLLDGER